MHQKLEFSVTISIFGEFIPPQKRAHVWEIYTSGPIAIIRLYARRMPKVKPDSPCAFGLLCPNLGMCNFAYCMMLHDIAQCCMILCDVAWYRTMCMISYAKCARQMPKFRHIRPVSPDSLASQYSQFNQYNLVKYSPFGQFGHYTSLQARFTKCGTLVIWPLHQFGQFRYSLNQGHINHPVWSVCWLATLDILLLFKLGCPKFGHFNQPVCPVGHVDQFF